MAIGRSLDLRVWIFWVFEGRQALSYCVVDLLLGLGPRVRFESLRICLGLIMPARDDTLTGFRV